MNSENSKQVAGSHTPGPWLVKKDIACDGAFDIRSESDAANWGLTGIRVSNKFNGSGPDHGPAVLVSAEQAEANARRIVACVNACDGISTEYLETTGLPEFAGKTLCADIAQDELDKVERQRDQLATKVADLELALFAENQKRQDVERQHGKLLVALELMLERTPEPPEANCSCHLSPPCNDCIDYGDEREAFEFAKDAIATVRGETP